MFTKKLLLSIASLAVISTAAIAATFANFTATPVTVPTNTVTAGSLSLSRGGSGAIYTLSNAKIGDSTTGSIAITNTGSLNGTLSLGGSTSGPANLQSAVQVTVYLDTDNTGTVVYTGALSGFSASDISIAAGATHTYYFHVSLPTAGSNAADNALQGESVSTTFTWNATQA